MLRNLVEEALRIPKEVENLTFKLHEAKAKIGEILKVREELEARTAWEVASERGEDGKPRFGNEHLRNGEVARRLKEDEAYQEAEVELQQAKMEAAELEARLEYLKLQHRSLVAILNLAAGALQAGNGEIFRQVLEQEAKQEEPKQNGNGKANGNGLVEMRVKVLSVAPGRKEGSVKALVKHGEDEFEVYANGKVAKELGRRFGEEVKIKAKRLESGNLFVVQAG